MFWTGAAPAVPGIPGEVLEPADAQPDSPEDKLIPWLACARSYANASIGALQPAATQVGDPDHRVDLVGQHAVAAAPEQVERQACALRELRRRDDLAFVLQNAAKPGVRA